MLSSATTFACFNAFLLITVLDISHDTKGVLSAALIPDSTCKCNGWFRVGLF